jgi:putative MATE family efflux protein
MKKFTGIELMESAPVSISIIRLAAPMMVGMIMQMIYNMTDMFFIGQTGDPLLVAGVSLITPLFLFIQGIGNLFATGAASYISRLMGAQKHEEGKHTNAVSFYTTILLGAAVTIVLLLLKNPLLHLIGTSNATFKPADDYFTIIIVFTIPSVVNVSLGGQMRSEGATTKAMISMLVGIILNIVLDPIFILLFGWGVAGAAWATVIGYVAGMIYGIVYFRSKDTVLSISWNDFKPNKTMYAEIMKIGIPTALSNVIMSVAIVLTNVIAAAYGDLVVAGNGVFSRLGSICFTLVMALAVGFQPLAGFNYGAKNYARLRKGFKITLLYTTALSVLFLIIFIFWGRAIITAFINDSQTIEVANTFLHAFMWGLPVLGVQTTIMIAFQALGKFAQATVITLGRQCVIYIPLLLILNHFFQFNGFIYAQPAGDILTAGVSLLLSVSMFRELKHSERSIESS